MPFRGEVNPQLCSMTEAHQSARERPLPCMRITLGSLTNDRLRWQAGFVSGSRDTCQPGGKSAAATR